LQWLTCLPAGRYNINCINFTQQQSGSDDSGGYQTPSELKEHGISAPQKAMAVVRHAEKRTSG
jgi:hypothetical protein